MALQKIIKVSGTGVYIPGQDIDTDQIIPARFLKCVTFEGLGEGLFRDLRIDETGRSKNHPLDRSENKDAKILFSGYNFGCGSSREHAPQSIFHFGLRAIVGGSFAEIFFGNCTTLGIPCITLPKTELESLSKLVEANSSKRIDVDLVEKNLCFLGRTYHFEIPESARLALISGTWDPLGELLEGELLTRALERLHYSKS